MSSLREQLMRYTPAALALSLLAAVTASVSLSAPPVPLDPRAAVLVAEGRKLLAGGDANGAIDAYEAALAVQPGHVAILLNLAEATRKQGMQGKALRYYREVLEGDPVNVYAISGEGLALVEKGAVDLKLSSLVEIARALGLEIKLVPRNALPAVDGAVRAHVTSVETSRALNLLNQQAQIADRIKANFPDLLPQVEAFQNVLRSIPRLQFDPAQLKALDEALKPAKRLTSIIEGQGGVVALAKRLEEATSALRQFRNMQVQHAPLIEAARPRPAYRLEEDDG